MAETICVIQENVQCDASQIKGAAKCFEKKVLSYTDDRTTISANQNGKSVYDESQSVVSLLGVNLANEVDNIRSLGLAFEQYDDMLADLFATIK